MRYCKRLKVERFVKKLGFMRVLGVDKIYLDTLKQ